MDYSLITALIAAVVIISSVNCRNYDETDKNDFGPHRRSVREVLNNKNQVECIPLETPAANNFNQLFEFGKTFARLLVGLEKMDSNNSSGDVIMFVGNTGAGKSSLVHLLAGDTSHFEAAEDSEGTGNFYILDTTGKHVTNTTTVSSTTYPEAIADADSGVIFFDTPGFRDTRSSIHEVIAMYGLHRVVKATRRVKLALLVNFDSLTTSGTRDDLTNSLKSFFSLLRNPDKYMYNTHLVATKVENRFIKMKGQLVPVSDETVINGIVTFLNGVKTSLESANNYNQEFQSEAVVFIRDLVDNRGRITLFRKPDEQGPIMNSETIRRSLATIRQSLLDADGYVNVEADDFGFTLSDKAKIYIRELFDLMNKYIIDVSKSFTLSFEQFLIAKYKNFIDITDIMASLVRTKHDVNVLIQAVNASKSPNDFADTLQSFVEDVGGDVCKNDTFREIKQLNDFLSNLKNVTDKNLYSPGKWADSLYDIERIVKNEQDYYVMLNNLFEKLTDHAALNEDFFVGISLVLQKYDKYNMLVDKRNYAVLMRHLGLDQFASLKINEDRLSMINSIYLKAKHQQAKSSSTVFNCKNSSTLVIAGNFLQLQTLDKNKIASCDHVTTVALLATNKIYIDTNLGVDILGGRNLVIIAPEWQVMGKFVISVDGASRGAAVEKAPNGVVGVDGHPGQSAGKFVGVALRYFNSEQLTITANGGTGQDGQDGGDGKHGKDGHDGNERTKVDDSKNIYIVYNSVKTTDIIKAEQGTSGGDAGMGGVGGAGGFAGGITLHSLTLQSPDRSTHVVVNGTEGLKGKDGKPGQGGLRGCDSIIKQTNRLILFIPVGSSSTQELLPCERRNPGGQLVSNEAKYSETPSVVPDPPQLCELYAKMATLFEPMNDIFSHKLFEEFQRVFNDKFNCNI